MGPAVSSIERGGARLTTPSKSKVPTRTAPFCLTGPPWPACATPVFPEVIEVGECGDRPYLVREFVAGHTLASELDTGPMEENRVLEIAKTLAGALDEVHRHGLIHRDVKPANISALAHRRGPPDRLRLRHPDQGLAGQHRGHLPLQRSRTGRHPGRAHGSAHRPLRSGRSPVSGRLGAATL